MPRIIGQIGSLKQIRIELNNHGISRFNSVKEINEFLRNYESEKRDIIKHHELEIDKEISNLKNSISRIKKDLEETDRTIRRELEVKKVQMLQRIEVLNNQEKSAKSLLAEIRIWFKQASVEQKLLRFDRTFQRNIERKTSPLQQRLEVCKTNFNHLTSNKQIIINHRVKTKLEEIDHCFSVLQNLNPLIAGAVGENLVLKELSELSDDFTVINDLTLRFEPPIFNKKEAYKIHSVQIDHLVVSKAGIFIIETKNWSKESIANLDLRSPVEQIKRAGYALFIILNGDNKRSKFRIKKHHWGEREIPIRKLLVLIKNKPKLKFKFVDMITLKELNNYFNHFEDVLDVNDVKRITEFLKNETT